MAATREQLFERLAALGIETTTVNHAPVFTVEESQRLRGELPGGHCKSLFLKDKKGALWLVVAMEDSRVDLKALQKTLGAGRLSFGKPELMAEVLGVTPGSVTPFAAINDGEGRVQVVLDERIFDHDTVNYHPLFNDATTALAPGDLVRFLEATEHAPMRITLEPAQEDAGAG
jgi:Ala-tRNA(Pro) deacylase